MIKDAILKLAKKENISYNMAKGAMNEIMGGKATDVQMSAYLTALSMKGETIEEVTASAEAMRSHCIKLLNDYDVLEIVGTGGDGSNSFNISTTASIVISAAGVPVAKHGNRAASSKSGAADVLEALGVNINVSPQESAEILNKINLCFLFAQNYHIAMKYVAPIRKELGIPTIFNILGPLANPAGATMQVMGVYNESLVKPLTEVLHNLGVKKALVVYGQDKLDEISVSAPTSVCEIKNGKILDYIIKPEDFGFERCSKKDLVGGDPNFNANITKSILNGNKGPKRNAVVINAAAGLYVAGKVKSLNEGVLMAEELIDTGKAKKQLELFIKLSNEMKF
jgi:anthranilate phosphoribosyltransferase